jgi:hypothetical protein
MPRRVSLRVLPFSVVPALLLVACAGDPGTGPGSPDYVGASKPQTQAVTLSDLVLSSTTMPISENAATYTVTMTNTKGKVSNATLQGIILQTRSSDGESVNQPAGGTGVACSGKFGDLPHGTCSYGFTINTAGQSQFGPLPEPGVATFRLELTDGVGNLLDFKEVSITLQ